MRYLIYKYRGLHNVKTRDRRKYADSRPKRLYGFAEARRLLQTGQLPIH
ncbi:hypothetical protein [Marinobacter halophilus]|nr:hypothetical protein [Marinobacter halophilus]GGC67405.1 hypothetical protein GCM10011362_14880 [Marinobacter halophilus]